MTTTTTDAARQRCPPPCHRLVPVFSATMAHSWKVSFATLCFMAVAATKLDEARAMSCEPIKIPMCKSMQWNVTSMPNHLHQSSQQNAQLSIEQYDALVRLNCSDSLLFFLCAMYAPICTATFQSDPVPPCRRLCESVRHGCEPTVKKYNRTWPDALSCEALPAYEEGVCISPEAFVAVRSFGPSEGERATGPSIRNRNDDRGAKYKCKDSMKFRKDDYLRHDYDYVIKVQYDGQSEHGSSTEIFTAVKVLKVLRNKSQLNLALGGSSATLRIWTISTSDCPRLQVGREYLMACYVDETSNRILFDARRCMAGRWRDGWIRTIREWNQLAEKPSRKTMKAPTRNSTAYSNAS